MNWDRRNKLGRIPGSRGSMQGHILIYLIENFGMVGFSAEGILLSAPAAMKMLRVFGRKKNEERIN